MKYLGLLAVLAVGFVSVASGPAHAMPVKLSISGSIVSPDSELCFGLCDPAFFEPSPGGIFAAGQKVIGSLIYDPTDALPAGPTQNGGFTYLRAGRNIAFSVTTSGGPYSGETLGTEPFDWVTLVCADPTCVASQDGFQWVNNNVSRRPGAPVWAPAVAGANLIAIALIFRNQQQLLSSNELLPGTELISFARQSQGLLGLIYAGEPDCLPCAVVAEVSLVVPEPSAGSILSIGFVGMIALRRRKAAGTQATSFPFAQERSR